MIRVIYYQRWWKNDRPECINKSKFIPSLAYSRAFIRVLQLIYIYLLLSATYFKLDIARNKRKKLY